MAEEVMRNPGLEYRVRIWFIDLDTWACSLEDSIAMHLMLKYMVEKSHDREYLVAVRPSLPLTLARNRPQAEPGDFFSSSRAHQKYNFALICSLVLQNLP